MADLFKLLGLVLVFEGIPWFLSPQRARELLRLIAQVSDRTLRFYGLAAMLLGLFVVYLATR